VLLLSDGTTAAGDAGVMAKVAACVRTGELGREGEKLKALEAIEGVVGWDWEREPYGQFGTGPLLLFLGRWRM
jgi:hypothetical protein